MADVTALAPWFGSARMIAPHVGQELAGCKWVGVPFAGGMTELLCIDAPSIVVSDLHRHVINLALTVQHEVYGRTLRRKLRETPFHPDAMARSQAYCKEYNPIHQPDLTAAYHYFCCCWMGRSHKSGIDDEFNGGVSIRWNGNGGDSNTRYRSAIRSLVRWQQVMRRCNFSVMDCFEFLARCEDAPRHGIYCDPPFPEVGDRYRHQFTEANHRRLAVTLSHFKETRVVCRFYRHELIEELYPECNWTWRRLVGRKQSNAEAPEVLVINGPSKAVADGLFGERQEAPA